jgi:hypothetical protein
VRVRPVGGTDKDWKSVFAFETATKATLQHFQQNAELDVTKGYSRRMPGWTHTYVNFETEGAVEVEISLADPIKFPIPFIAPPTNSNGTWTNTPPRPVNGIVAAAVHPRRKSSKPVNVIGGKVVVTLDQPCQVAVDINGQLDNQRTGSGSGYSGQPVHTISIFANPPIKDKPKKGDPKVRFVKPGQSLPTDLKSGETLAFEPGVHKMETLTNGDERIDKYIRLQNGCSYYIPGDAIVYGRFNTGGDTKTGVAEENGSNIRIFGHGTLSGANVPNPRFTKPKAAADNLHYFYRPIYVEVARNTKVEGITIVDSANLSIVLQSDENGQPNSITWTKIITWRVNGDGINPSGNTAVEDCFLRTADDAIGTKGLGIRRVVLWNDANGSSFRLSDLAKLKRGLIVQGCDVIYARSYLQGTSASRVFNVRGDHKENGASGANQVIFRNINIEDPWPTLQHFFICLEVPPGYGEPQKATGGNFSNIIFENISIAKLNVLNEPELLWGHAGATISNFTFKNLKVRNELVTSRSNFFKTNEFVSNIRFQDANGNFV